MSCSNKSGPLSYVTNGWPKVSVITVVKNDREGIEKTIRSVSTQDYPNLEYIVVDGVSTDGTLDVILANENLISSWVSEPDSGLYDAMNKGKAMAGGERALFLNAGDTFVADNVLRCMLTPLPSNDTIVFGNVLVAYGNLEWHRPPRKDGKALLFDGYVPHHQSVLYPKAFFRVDDYDLRFRVVADVDFTSRAIALLPKEHRDVDLVVSTLGGFTFTAYGSLEGARKMYRERLAYYKKHVSSFSIFQSAGLALLVFAKYLGVKLGGVSLAARLMYWKLKLMRGSYR